LSAFRNYSSLRFTPDPGLNILVGPNGQGKTSLLEAFHVVLTGRSFRTARLVECVRWGEAEGGVGGEVVRDDQRRPVRLIVAPRGRSVEVDGQVCPWARAVTFSAVDLGLLTGPPGGRRAYLDGAAAKLLPAHTTACRRYRIALYQRGRLLVTLGGRPDADRLLAPWDEQIAQLGSQIVHRRIETLAALGEETAAIWRVLAPGGPPLELGYAPAVAPGPDPERTRETLLEALAVGRREELRRGVTLAGPHRDDLVVRLGEAEVRTYGSRGEQRLVVLALRLAETGPVRHRVGTAPVLLLDDLLSELDGGARTRVLAWLAAQGQVLFSATDATRLPEGVGTVWAVQGGGVEAVEAAAVRGAA